MSLRNSIFTIIQQQFKSDNARTDLAVEHLATNYANAKGLQIQDFWQNHDDQFHSDFSALFAESHNAAIANQSFNDEQKLSAFENHMVQSF